jgi:hypothetical protein
MAVEEVEVEIVLDTAPDVQRIVDGLAEHLGLAPELKGMTSTFDRMVDTEDLALMSQDHSLRVRQKLGNVYSGNEFRLTYKYPLREHERLFIRAEEKMKLADPDYDAVLQMLSNITWGVCGQRLKTQLHINELANEVNLGPKGKQLNLSIDQCTYSLTGDAERTANEIVFEIESHGVGHDIILAASDWVMQQTGGREAARCKYSRGLQLLGKL